MSLDSASDPAERASSGAERRVAIVGSGTPGAMAISVCRGFGTLGCEARVFPYYEWAPTPSSLLRALEGRRGLGALDAAAFVAARPLVELRLVAELARFSPSLVLLLKCDDLHRATYQAIRKATGAAIAAFHPDDPWNRGRGWPPGPSHPRALVQMREVDHYFVWSRALVERAKQQGARSAHYLAFAYDPELHPRVEPTPAERAEFACDALFVGNWDEERERWLAPLAESGADLAVWGSDYWGTRCRSEPVRRCYRGRTLIGREQAAAVASAKLCINVLRKQNKGATNMRTFEIPGMGGLMLHERSAEAEAFFPDGEAAVYFDSPEGLVEAVRRWSAEGEASEAARAALKARGRELAERQSYGEWAAEVEGETIAPKDPRDSPRGRGRSRRTHRRQRQT